MRPVQFVCSESLKKCPIKVSFEIIWKISKTIENIIKNVNTNIIQKNGGTKNVNFALKILSENTNFAIFKYNGKQLKNCLHHLQSTKNNLPCLLE